MSALAEVVLVSMHHHRPADDGVLPRQGDHRVRDVQLGASSLRSDVPEISGMSRSLLVLRGPVLALVRVEVRPGASAAVSVVSELQRGTLTLPNHCIMVNPMVNPVA